MCPHLHIWSLFLFLQSHQDSEVALHPDDLVSHPNYFLKAPLQNTIIRLGFYCLYTIDIWLWGLNFYMTSGRQTKLKQ